MEILVIDELCVYSSQFTVLGHLLRSKTWSHIFILENSIPFVIEYSMYLKEKDIFTFHEWETYFTSLPIWMISFSEAPHYFQSHMCEWNHISWYLQKFYHFILLPMKTQTIYVNEWNPQISYNPEWNYIVFNHFDLEILQKKYPDITLHFESIDIPILPTPILTRKEKHPLQIFLYIPDTTQYPYFLDKLLHVLQQHPVHLIFYCPHLKTMSIPVCQPLAYHDYIFPNEKSTLNLENAHSIEFSLPRKTFDVLHFQSYLQSFSISYQLIEETLSDEDLIQQLNPCQIFIPMTYRFTQLSIWSQVLQVYCLFLHSNNMNEQYCFFGYQLNQENEDQYYNRELQSIQKILKVSEN